MFKQIDNKLCDVRRFFIGFTDADKSFGVDKGGNVSYLLTGVVPFHSNMLDRSERKIIPSAVAFVYFNYLDPMMAG